MFYHLRDSIGKLFQAAAGALALGGVAVTSVASSQGGDRLTTLIGAVATFFAFLVHRQLAMKDVKRVVRDVVKEEVDKMVKNHEAGCKWVIRPSLNSPPREAE